MLYFASGLHFSRKASGSYVTTGFRRLYVDNLVSTSALRGGLANDVENSGVADNDGETGYEECQKEEKLLRASSFHIRQDRARSDSRIQSETSPLFEPRDDQHTESNDPYS